VDASLDAAPVEEPDDLSLPTELVTLLDGETTNLLAGTSPTVRFEVPENAVSVSVVIQGKPEGTYVLGAWRDAADHDLVPAGWAQEGQLGPSLCDSCNNRVAASEATFASIAPNNPKGVFAPGTHQIHVLGFTQDGFSLSPIDGQVRITVLAKVRERLPSRGVLHLNLHFTGAGGWDAASAATDPEVQGMLDEVRAIYAQASVELGEIRY